MSTLSAEVSFNASSELFSAFKVIKKSRKEQAELLSTYEMEAKQSSKRQATRLLQIPRSTIQYWEQRKSELVSATAKSIFFESIEGIEFLHLLVTSLLFVMVQLGGCGLKLVKLVLEKIQVHHYIGCSIGSLHKLNAKMEEDIANFGESESQRLAKNMPTKKISMAGDETFHPKPCLVAIEPVSNYILAEKYSEKRDADSWSKVMTEKLSGLPVEVVQVASDERKGLVKYTEKELGAHHSPDLFHVQQEITRATAAPIRARLKQAEASSEECIKEVAAAERELDRCANANKAHTTWKALGDAISRAEHEAKAAKDYVDEVKQLQANVKEAKKALGTVYHPYDLQTGKAQSTEMVSQKLEEHFSVIENTSEELELSENSMKRLDKAHRVFQYMRNTIAFFWVTVQNTIDNLGFSTEVELLIREFLIPAHYLKIAASKAGPAKEKHHLEALSKMLLAQLEIIHRWCTLPESIKKELKTVAKQCAELFQRSSSCVEGRNGYLSLQHHGLHKLSERKLKVLTTLHNYFIERKDGTTAAERFFEQKPQSLFEYLIHRLPYPPRPVKKLREIAA